MSEARLIRGQTDRIQRLWPCRWAQSWLY